MSNTLNLKPSSILTMRTNFIHYLEQTIQIITISFSNKERKGLIGIDAVISAQIVNN